MVVDVGGYWTVCGSINTNSQTNRHSLLVMRMKMILSRGVQSGNANPDLNTIPPLLAIGLSAAQEGSQSTQVKHT